VKKASTVCTIFFLFSTIIGIEDAVAFSNSCKPYSPIFHPPWTHSPFEQKVFIENKGQFGERTEVKDEIFFQVESGGLCIYFTKRGLVYRYNETIVKKDDEEETGKGVWKEEDEEEERRRQRVVKHYSLEMQWQGSNSAVEISPSDKESFYYTYSIDSANSSRIIIAST